MAYIFASFPAACLIKYVDCPALTPDSIIACGCGLWLAQRELQRRGGAWSLSRIIDREKLKRMAVVNFDIMIRSIAVVFAFSIFTAKSAEVSDVVLAKSSY